MNFLFALAQTAPAAPPAATSPPIWMYIAPIALMLFVLYFLTIRPQKKKEDDRKKMIDSVKKGDKVLTIGGIYGTIVQIKDEDLIIRIDPAKDICVKLTRAGIHRVITSEKGEDGKA